MKKSLTVYLASSILMVSGMGSLHAQENEKVNNGTDPTLLATTLSVQYKHSELRTDDSIGLFEVEYSTPINKAGTMSLGFTLPYASGVIDNDYDLGDVSAKLVHVIDLNQERGIAYTAEIFFDTADRNELGSGQTVLELSTFYAKFLQGGAIVAPSLVQRVDLSDNKNRSNVNSTTLDLYYVPKLEGPWYMTYDPAYIVDWENDQNYGSLTVTFGRVLGKAFGGDSQVFFKPQVLGGGDRPIDWSFQLGYKVLGF